MTFTPDLTDLEQQTSSRLLFRCVAGSHAYGLAGPHSDVDFRGIYALPGTAFLAIEPPPAQVSDAKGDIVYYSLKRFVELALDANPNILELLFMPSDCIRFQSPLFEPLLAARAGFVTRQAYSSHVGYAMAQIGKARGRNKWINNPQPETPPAKEAFCWIIPAHPPATVPPYRPVPLRQTGINLAECHCAALEHASGLYRLYHYGTAAKGVFRQDNLVCESIPRDDEACRCIGLLLYAREAYEQALRDHRHYWEWMKIRNESRWITQERGETDYDAKNMMHTFRLLLSGANILRHGEPIVRFDGEPREFLLAIRAGQFAYSELIGRAEQLLAELNTLHDQSSLPRTPDREALQALFIDITRQWEKLHA
jgi:predicted nucleotidyltransferase